MPAFVELWSRMPGYRWLASLLTKPGARQIAALLYDHVIAPSVANLGSVWRRRAKEQLAPVKSRGRHAERSIATRYESNGHQEGG